jgi:hypothetical protein
MSEEKEVKKEIKVRTNDELKQIAIDLYDGRIFSDRQVVNPKDMAMVFMPLALGALSKMSKEDTDDINMIYEYLDKAGPRSINGMPNFFSVNLLRNAEAKTMFKFYDEYKGMKEKFMDKKES